MSASQPNPHPPFKCQVTGQNLDPQTSIELWGYRVGALGKALLLERFRSGAKIDPPQLEGAAVTAGERLSAGFIDAILLMVVFACMGLVSAVIFENHAATLIVLLLVGPCLLTAINQWSSVSSFGKFMISAKIETESGSRPGLVRIAWRSVLATLPIALMVLVAIVDTRFFPRASSILLVIAVGLALVDWLMLAATAPARTLHDICSGTRVVRSQTNNTQWPDASVAGWTGVWGRFSFRCPKCGTLITTISSAPRIGEVGCVTESTHCPKKCGWNGMVTLFRPAPLDNTPPLHASPEDSACAAHPDRRAVATCDGSGDFCCSLCALEFDGKIYSAAYLTAHPIAPEKLRSPLSPGKSEALAVKQDFVAIAPTFRTKNTEPLRLHFDRIESLITWKELRSTQKTIGKSAWIFVVVGLLFIGLLFNQSLFWVVTVFGAAAFTGSMSYRRSTKTQNVVWISRGTDSIHHSESESEPGFDEKIDSLKQSLVRVQKERMDSWIQSHPDDPTLFIPEKSSLAKQVIEPAGNPIHEPAKPST